MSSNISQIYSTNPVTSMDSNDLLYLGRSPYGTNNDSAIQFSDFVSSVNAVNKTILQITEVSISSDQINSLYDTPVTLLSASTLGANYIFVEKVVFIYEFATTPYVIGGDLVVQYGNAPNGAGPAATVNTSGVGVLDQSNNVFAWSPGSFISPIPDGSIFQTDICLSNLGGDYSAGDGSLGVVIWYQYI